MKLQWCVLWFVLLTFSLPALADVELPEWMANDEPIKLEDFRAEEPAPLVGMLGDPRQIEFEGLEQLTAAQLQWALSGDLVYQAAARTTAPLGDLVNTLENRLREGLLHSGFLQATVAASYRAETDSLHVVVHEGQQLKNGNIVVKGTRALDAESLALALQTQGEQRPWSTCYGQAGTGHFDNEHHSKAIWETDAITQGDGETIDRFTARVRQLTMEQGYPFARFTLEVVPGPDKIATLVIDVEQEGTSAVLTEVLVRGLERHSEEQLLTYLGLELGMTLDAEVFLKVQRKLRESCRFWNYQLYVRVPTTEAERYAEEPTGLELAIYVVEYPHTPPLGEPLTEAEETLKRTALWLERFVDEGGEFGDVVVEVPGKPSDEKSDSIELDSKLIVSPNYGFAWTIELHDGKQFSVNHTILSVDNVLTVINREGLRAIAIELSQFLEVSLEGSGIVEGEYLSQFKFGWKGGVNRWKSRWEPVALVNLLYRNSSKHEIVDDELLVDALGIRLRIDRSSGRLKDVSVSPSDPNAVIPFPMRVSFQKNAFQEAVSTITDLEDQCEAFYDSSRPLASLLEFLLVELLDQPLAKESNWLHFTLKYLRNGLADDRLYEFLVTNPPLANFNLGSWSASDDIHFAIPGVELHFGNEGLLYLLDDIVPRTPLLADILLPRGSWPWTYAREAAFFASSYKSSLDLTDGARAEFAATFKSKQTGTLGKHVFAIVGRHLVPADQMTKLVRALKKHYHEESFAQDIRLLVHGEHGFAQAVHFAIITLDSLGEEEKAMLSAELEPTWRKPFEALLERRQSHPEESPADAVEAVARQWWNDGLEDYFHAELEKLTPREVARR